VGRSVISRFAERLVPVLLVLHALTSPLSCAGEVETGKDSTPTPDSPGQTDTAPADGRRAEGIAGEGVSPADSLGDGSLGACDPWSAWTCAADTNLLCKATCQTGSKQYAIGCTSTGHCVCGVASTPCGPYSYTSPCDACQQAALGGCCMP